jgi:transcriptional regulator with XRE-family HTH domain
MDIPGQLHYVISQIRKIRIQKNISQVELSLRSNLSQSFLANLEKEKKAPSVLTLLKIADALGVNPTEFFFINITVEPKQQIKEKIVNLLEYL